MAAIPKPGIGPYGPVVVFGTCFAGAVIGGVADHWLTGSGRAFGAFGAAFGMSIGGLVGASLVEFLLPFALALFALNTGSPAATPAVAPAAPPAEEAISLAGRLLQIGVGLVILALGAFALRWGVEPIADAFALSEAVAAVLLGGVALALGGIGVLGSGALARHLDLTVQ
jgi:hypothetical protein